jgi:hypothetical protein
MSTPFLSLPPLLCTVKPPTGTAGRAAAHTPPPPPPACIH